MLSQISHDDETRDNTRFADINLANIRHFDLASLNRNLLVFPDWQVYSRANFRFDIQPWWVGGRAVV